MKKEILKDRNLMMSKADMESLKKISDKQGCSVSWLVRQAVKAYLIEKMKEEK